MSKNPFYEEDDDEDGEGSGSQSTGEINFRYKDIFSGPTRDDLLSPEEIKRLSVVHKDLHKQRVDKQKHMRDTLKDLKEGKIVTAEQRYQHGLGSGSAGTSSKYKKHPISEKAQFSGIDKQVVAVPSLNEANTNDELRNELENRLDNKYRNQPSFNPKPRYPGG